MIGHWAVGIRHRRADNGAQFCFAFDFGSVWHLRELNQAPPFIRLSFFAY